MAVTSNWNRISMSYNSLLVCLILLLAGCASAPTPPEASDNTAKAQAEANREIAMYAIAMADIQDNKLQTAQELLTKITDKRPELAGPWANLALIDIKNKDYAKARQHVNKALKRDPALPQAYNLLGFLDKQDGNINQAIDDYQQAIAKKPDYAVAHYNVALLYDIYLQDIPNAIQHYKRYLDLTNNQDQRTADWVKELESSLKRGTP
jgi:tetratricopeptide (TPR) repeat protein